MKLFIAVLMLMSINVHAKKTMNCEVRWGDRVTVHPTRCPNDLVVVGSRTDHIGQFTYTYVACTEMKLECEMEFNDEMVIQQITPDSN
jgi:hypothetical protein